VLAAKVLDSVTITLGRKGKKQSVMPLSNEKVMLICELFRYALSATVVVNENAYGEN
jgi:hypothetical protein